MLSMRFTTLCRAGAVLILALFAPLTSVAANAVIDQAKAECLIGEQADGYLGVVAGKNPSAAVRREMRDINQQRKSAYTRLAERNGVTVEVTAALTAEKLIAQAGRGQCVRKADGSWVEVR